MKRILCLVILLLVATVAMFADIARPGKQTKPVAKPGLKVYSNSTSDLTIRFDSNIERPTLRIPKTQLGYLRAQNENGESDENNTAAVTAPGGFSRTQTFVSGVFLSLAIVFGGMWFVRSGKAASKEGKALIALAVLTGIGSAATFVYADIAPPQPVNDITSKIFNQDAMWRGEASSWNVRIESTNGDKIELYVPDPPAPGSPASNVNK
jgi:hypothetical protein